MRRVTRRPLAEADILEIWDYIADDSVAAAVAGSMSLTRSSSGDTAVMGRVRDELGPAMRSFPFGRYVIFYIAITKASMWWRLARRQGQRCGLHGRVAADLSPIRSVDPWTHRGPDTTGCHSAVPLLQAFAELSGAFSG